MQTVLPRISVKSIANRGWYTTWLIDIAHTGNISASNEDPVENNRLSVIYLWRQGCSWPEVKPSTPPFFVSLHRREWYSRPLGRDYWWDSDSWCILVAKLGGIPVKIFFLVRFRPSCDTNTLNLDVPEVLDLQLPYVPFVARGFFLRLLRLVMAF